MLEKDWNGFVYLENDVSSSQSQPSVTASSTTSQPMQQGFEQGASAPAIDSNFSAKLQQMHEFGFMDDAENIQALMLTNGDVEQALQIVVAMRE